MRGRLHAKRDLAMPASRSSPTRPGRRDESVERRGTAEAALGACFTRFRFGSVSNLSFTGLAPDGEVEDYLAVVRSPVDVSIASVVEPGLVAVGNAVTVTVLVTNRGPSGAERDGHQSVARRDWRSVRRPPAWALAVTRRAWCAATGHAGGQRWPPPFRSSPPPRKAGDGRTAPTWVVRLELVRPTTPARWRSTR